MEARSSGTSVPLSGRVVEPSIANALPHFVPLAIFPLVVCAAMYGGWWIVGPLVFFMLAGQFDRAFGLEERNMDPATTRESQLFPYKLSLWLWAAFWPVCSTATTWKRPDFNLRPHTDPIGKPVGFFAFRMAYRGTCS